MFVVVGFVGFVCVSQIFKIVSFLLFFLVCERVLGFVFVFKERVLTFFS